MKQVNLSISKALYIGSTTLFVWSLLTSINMFFYTYLIYHSAISFGRILHSFLATIEGVIGGGILLSIAIVSRFRMKNKSDFAESNFYIGVFVILFICISFFTLVSNGIDYIGFLTVGGEPSSLG